MAVREWEDVGEKARSAVQRLKPRGALGTAAVVAVGLVLAACGGGTKPTYGQVKAVVEGNDEVKGICPAGFSDQRVKNEYGDEYTNLECNAPTNSHEIVSYSSYSSETDAKSEADTTCTGGEPETGAAAPENGPCLLSGKVLVYFRPLSKPSGYDWRLALELADAVKRDCGCGQIPSRICSTADPTDPCASAG